MAPILSERYERALVYAHQLHRAQKRRGTEIPYITHLLSVSSLVLEHGGDEDEAIAALLHDGPEDQGGLATLAEIRERFGDRVAEIVAGCTDSYEDPKPPWRPRKEAYLAHLQDAPPSARLVASADKLHNARSVLADHRVIGDAIWDRFNAPREGTLWYYRSLVCTLRKAGSSPLLDELDRVVGELERLGTGPAEG